MSNQPIRPETTIVVAEALNMLVHTLYDQPEMLVSQTKVVTREQLVSSLVVQAVRGIPKKSKERIDDNIRNVMLLNEQLKKNNIPIDLALLEQTPADND